MTAALPYSPPHLRRIIRGCPGNGLFEPGDSRVAVSVVLFMLSDTSDYAAGGGASYYLLGALERGPAATNESPRTSRLSAHGCRSRKARHLKRHPFDTAKGRSSLRADAAVAEGAAETNGRVVGFLELDFRKYAPGCRSSPVAFIEGWHVEAAHQRKGIGRALIEAAEARATAMGHAEIASDSELDNADGIAAHRALGFEEIERVACFRRSLRDA